MPQLPRYPQSKENSPPEQNDGMRRSTKTYALVAIAVLLVLLMVALHLAGIVGPGSN